MRKLLIAAVLAVGPAVAQQEDPFLTGDALQAEIAKSCADGCLVLNRQEAQNLTRNVASVVGEREKAAYKQGKQACWKSI